MDEDTFFRYRDGALETLARLPSFLSPLALGPDGKHFYAGVGANVYSLAPDGSTKIAADIPGSMGAAAQVVFDPAGKMFGTTHAGGAHGTGTVFRVKDF